LLSTTASNIANTMATTAITIAITTVTAVTTAMEEYLQVWSYSQGVSQKLTKNRDIKNKNIGLPH
jgi:hypothetical protein